jgi:ABC-type proline/glycine betaine transport system ATPase subunit
MESTSNVGELQTVSSVYTRLVEGQRNSAVEARDLIKTHGEGSTAVRALKGISLDFPPGEFAAIMGPSGSGKSTLLHLLGALDQPSSGKVIVGGEDLSGMSDKKLTHLRRERMGFVFQFFNLIPTLSAEENALLPVLISGGKPDVYADRLTELLDLVGLEKRRNHSPSPSKEPGHNPGRRTYRQPRHKDRHRRFRVTSDLSGALRTDRRHGHPRSPSGGHSG